MEPPLFSRNFNPSIENHNLSAIFYILHYFALKINKEKSYKSGLQDFSLFTVLGGNMTIHNAILVPYYHIDNLHVHLPESIPYLHLIA